MKDKMQIIPSKDFSGMPNSDKETKWRSDKCNKNPNHQLIGVLKMLRDATTVGPQTSDME